MTATATKSRKPARETHGTCRLVPACNLPLPEALDAGEAMLSIVPERGEPTNYLVQRLSDPDGQTVGFRLLRLAAFIVDRKVYDIDVTGGFGLRCDCPDCEFRSRECKHIRALRSALARVGIAIATPKRQQAAPVMTNAEEPIARVLLGGEMHRQEMAAPAKPAPRQPWCEHCNDNPDVYCSHCSL